MAVIGLLRISGHMPTILTSNLTMKTTAIRALLAFAGSWTSAVFAQSVSATTPSIPDAPTAPSAPVAAAAPTISAPGEMTAPNQVVYTARLPAVQELTDAAAAHGTEISRIEQSTTQITVTYQLANGRTNVVAYQLLPSPGSASSGTRIVSSPPPTVVTAPPPAIVYTPRQRVVYYDTYPTYDPWYWYPPVSLSFGFGFGGGRHGYYRGGYGHGFHHRRH